MTESDNVIRQDFGKADREHARRFARLMRLVEEREEDILRDPGKYLKAAADQHAEICESVRLAQDALRQSVPSLIDGPPELNPIRIVSVDREEWERLTKAADLLQRIRL